MWLSVADVAANTFDHNEFGWEMGWVARSLFLHQGFSSPFLPFTGPTALVPPLYPWLISRAFVLFGLYTWAAAVAVLSFNSLCSALTCIPLYFLGRNSLGERLGRLTAVAWALFPLSVYFSANRVWDYALTGLLFSLCLLLAQQLHRRAWAAWAGFGLLYGLAVLSNPSVLPMLPVLLIVACWQLHRQGRTWALKSLLSVAAFLAVCAPWQVRNHRVMHADFLLRDGFAIEFYAGNNGNTFESNSAAAHPASNAAEMLRYQQLGEIGYIAEKHQLAVEFVAHHPAWFALACMHRVVRFWTGWWSFSPAYMRYQPLDLPLIPMLVFLLWAMIRGIRRWWARDRAAAMPYLAAVILFPAPYYLTHSSPDYRQPLEPVVIMLVCVGLFGLDSAKAQATLERSSAEKQGSCLAPQFRRGAG